MRFYTLDRYAQDYSLDGNFSGQKAADKEYTAHVQTLPPNLRELALLEGTDDGLIVEAHWIHSINELLLVLRYGDLIMGYCDLVLRYKNVTLTPEHERTLARLARAEIRQHSFRFVTGDMMRKRRKQLQYLPYRPDLYRHEVDTVEGSGFEHRFLFHPGYWFAVQCDDLSWERIPRPDRSFVSLPDRFLGGAATFERRGTNRRRAR